MKHLPLSGRRVWRVVRYGLFILPAVVALLFYEILPKFPQITECIFSRGLYRLIGTPLGFLTSLLPFSLTELLAVAAFPAAVVLVILFIRRLRRSEHPWSLAGRVGRGTGWVLSCVLLLYMLMHGLNFYRQPVSDLMELDTSRKSAEYLQAVCTDLARKASAEREKLTEDADGCMKLNENPFAALRQADDGYRRLDDKYPFLWSAVYRAKPVQLSHYWSYTGITGMYFPFFSEANINIDQPDSYIPATAAHELAHTRGFAREDECNFFACLSCWENESAEYRYSGYLLAYTYCGNALYAYNHDMWAEASAYCSDGMKRDLHQNNEYWKAFEGPVQEVSSSVNNSFIQSQGVHDGVLSYDRVVELVLAYYEKEGLV